VDADYLFHWVKSPNFVRDMSRKATGASYPAVSDRIILESEVPLPSLPEQRRIATILDKADELRRKRRIGLNQLDIFKESLFSGFYEQTRHLCEKRALVDIAAPTKGSFVNGPFGSDLLTSEFQDHGVPVIYVRDVRSGEYQRISRVFVSNKKAQDLSICSVQPGDILVAKVGDPPGTAAAYPNSEPAAVITQDVIRIRLDNHLVMSEFVVAYLNSSIGKSKVKRITIEATRARFSLGDFKALTIEIPPLVLQREFADRVDALKRTILQQRASFAKLDELFTSLQHRAFRGAL
jgi:type I restriction enzyme S subunit